MDIVIIGAQKAGTTWLYGMLKQQRRVGFSFMKEVHYFNQVAKPDFSAKARLLFLKKHRAKNEKFLKSKYKKFIDHVPYRDRPKYRAYMDYVLDGSEVFTDQWYKNTFLLKPQNQKIVSKYGAAVYCDATPAYGSMPEHGVAHLARVLPGIVPVLIIRDPVKRMISGFSMSLSRRLDRESWTLDESLNRLRTRQAPRGDYARTIPLYRKYFSELMIIPFGQIRTDPASVLRQIEQKFSLDRVTYEGLAERRNSHTGKVEMEPEILNEIERLCAPQQEYLAKEFGQGFLSTI